MKILLTILLVHGLILTQTHPENQKWVKLATNVDLILVAEVKQVGPTPGFWSGLFAASQRIRFKVVKVLKGNLKADEVEVEYYLVKNDELVDNERPRLSPEIFKAGNQVVLFLKADRKRRSKSFAADQNCGTAMASADILKALSR
jgi:hypothetical protein